MILSIGFVTLVSLGCRSEAAKSPDGAAPGRAPSAAANAPGGSAAAAPAAGVPAAGALPDPQCGRSPSDWCAAPAGDPCGAHKNVESCRADPACRGMKYRGEGPECKTDERSFGIGCPTVGCLSR